MLEFISSLDYFANFCFEDFVLIVETLSSIELFDNLFKAILVDEAKFVDVK